MEVGDALVGIHHGKRRTRSQGGLDIGFDFLTRFCGKRLNLCCQIAEPVVEVHTEFLDDTGVFGDEVPEKDLHDMAENQRVGNLHHRRLQVDGEKHTRGLRFGDLLFEKCNQRLFAEKRGIENFAGLE